jgi:hypothetical protein
MARLFNYRFLLVLALVLGWMSLATSVASAIVGVEIGDRTVAPAPAPVPAINCPPGANFCECHGEEDCQEMFKKYGCLSDVCEGSGDNTHCICLYPIGFEDPEDEPSLEQPQGGSKYYPKP